MSKSLFERTKHVTFIMSTSESCHALWLYHAFVDVLAHTNHITRWSLNCLRKSHDSKYVMVWNADDIMGLLQSTFVLSFVGRLQGRRLPRRMVSASVHKPIDISESLWILKYLLDKPGVSRFFVYVFNNWILSSTESNFCVRLTWTFGLCIGIDLPTTKVFPVLQWHMAAAYLSQNYH